MRVAAFAVLSVLSNSSQLELSARMISEADCMNYLLARCPDFHTWYREHLEGWEEPDDVLTEFASYVAELVERNEAERLEAAATVIERLMTEGHDEVKSAARSFLSELTGSCDGVRKPFRRFARYLGPESLAYCRHLFCCRMEAGPPRERWTDDIYCLFLSDDQLLRLQAKRMTREERTAICKRFQRYCGENYGKFLWMLSTVCIGSGRLGTWPENRWRKFIATQGLNLSTEFIEVFGILEDELERMISRRASEDQERRPERPPLRVLIGAIIGISLLVTLLAGAMLASPVVWWFYGPLWAIGTAIASVILWILTPFNHLLEPVLLVNIIYCALAAGQFQFF